MNIDKSFDLFKRECKSWRIHEFLHHSNGPRGESPVCVEDSWRERAYEGTTIPAYHSSRKDTSYEQHYLKNREEAEDFILHKALTVVLTALGS